MTGYIPITNSGGQEIGYVEWTGTNERGTWVLYLNPKVDEAYRGRFLNAVADASSLKTQEFTGPLLTVIHGWEGFWGTAMAMRVALRKAGLVVHLDRCEPPEKVETFEDDIGDLKREQ